MNEHAKSSHPLPIDDNLLTRESWKVFQIMAEFVEGFERLAAIRPSVSMFGSART
ncbi:MAG: TIGR00730 family Rossman fold protein, partial [bacterium]